MLIIRRLNCTDAASGIVTGYFSKSGTRAPPREYYAWWSQELLRSGNKDNCGWAFFRFIHTYALLVISLTFAINYLRPTLLETLSTNTFPYIVTPSISTSSHDSPLTSPCELCLG